VTHQKPTYEELELRIKEFEKEAVERNRIELLLRESRQRYRALAENSLVGFWHITLEGYTIYINPAMCTMLEIEHPKELTGKTYHSYFTPESIEIVEIEHAKRLKDIASTYEVEIVGKQGGRRNVAVSGAPLFNSEGKIVSKIATFTDITSRIQTEEALRENIDKYRSLVEDSMDGIAIVQDLEIKFVNPELIKMLGYQNDQEIVGHDFAEFVSPKDKDLLLQMGRDREKGTDIPGRYQFRAIRKDGSGFDAELSVGLISYQGGVARQGIVRDISKEKEAKEALQKAHDELEFKVKERTRELEIKTSNLEEINTVLNVLLKKRNEDKLAFEEQVVANVKKLVMPYLHKMKHGKIDEKQQALISIIETSLNEIISPFTFKLSSTYLSLTPSEVQVADLVRQGKKTKEIAKLLNRSYKTIERHRENIRRKVGIINRRVNLRSYLLSLH